MEQKISKLKEERKKIRQEFENKLANYVGAGLGLVAGLAWNDAIKTFIEEFFPDKGGSTVIAKFAYALLMTLVVVVITYYLSKIFKKDEEKKIESKK